MELSTLTRLKKVAARQTLTLTHYGRKTGKRHEVTIWFVFDGEKFYIGTANVNRQWVRNVQKTPQINCPLEARGSRARHASSPTVPSTNAVWLPFTGSTGCMCQSWRWGRFSSDSV